jgi:hypothetical protein
VSFLSFFIRQYGAREYGVTLAVAAIAGVVIAVLINSASGGAGQPALLKTAQEQVAKASPAPVAPRVSKPVAKTQPASHRKSRRHHRRHRAHRARVVPAIRTAPVVRPTEESNTPTPTTAPAPTTTPAPAPVVRKPAPAPKPAPKTVPSRKGGGGIQFDDSG